MARVTSSVGHREQQDAESRRKEAAEKSRLEEEAAQQRVIDEQAKASAALTAASNTHTAINKANDDLVAEPVEVCASGVSE